MTFGSRRYRVRGLEKNLSYEVLKVNVLVAAPALEGAERDAQAVHLETLDLYQARARAAFVKGAAAELGVTEETIKADVGQVAARVGDRTGATDRRAQVPEAPQRAAVEGEACARALAAPQESRSHRADRG